MNETPTDVVKDELHRKLQAARAAVLTTLDGLGEYDRRRPLTASGTNLLGLVKHLSGGEYTYLGTSLGRTPPEVLPWEADGSVWLGADMWATALESGDEIVERYRRACAHGDASIAALPLDAPASVAHWPEHRRRTTLGVLLIRMLEETAHHAGHADIVRELIDGRGGSDSQELGEDRPWSEYLDRVQAAADAFR